MWKRNANRASLWWGSPDLIHIGISISSSIGIGIGIGIDSGYSRADALRGTLVPILRGRYQSKRPVRAISIRRAMRSSVDGCVENRFAMPPPDSGFMIIICAVDGCASAVGNGMPLA